MTGIKRKIIPAVVFIMSLHGQAFCAKSAILNYVMSFVPTIKEGSDIANIVNIYDKVSQVVRSTIKIVNSVKEGEQEYKKMCADVNKICESVKYLSNINIYDMDSWQKGVDGFNSSIKTGDKNLNKDANMFNVCTVDAAAKYVTSLSTLDSFASARNAKRSWIEKNYYAPDNSAQRIIADSAVAVYRNRTRAELAKTQSELADQLTSISDTASGKYKDLKAEYEAVSNKIERIDRQTLMCATSTRDEISDECSEMISNNLTELQRLSDKLNQYESETVSMLEQYERLKNEENSVYETAGGTPPDLPQDTGGYFDSTGKNPDKAPPPKPAENPAMDQVQTKRETSNHDILNLSNAVQYLLLKQEILKRDIYTIELNILALRNAKEAKKDYEMVQKSDVEGMYSVEFSNAFQEAADSLK